MTWAMGGASNRERVTGEELLEMALVMMHERYHLGPASTCAEEPCCELGLPAGPAPITLPRLVSWAHE